MFDVLQDFRYGIRMMLKAPVLVAIAVVSLALGIAANTVTFGVTNGFFFRPFPYHKQEELVLIREVNRNQPENDEGVTAGTFHDWRERTTVFEDLMGYRIEPANMTRPSPGFEPERVQVVPMTPQGFSVLGREPFLGRNFRIEEGVTGASPVVILGYPFWRRSFGENRAILGETVTLDGKSYSIAGVMPEDFDFLPANVDLYRPDDFMAAREDRKAHDLLVIGRLKRERSAEEAQAELDTIAIQLEERYPETNQGYGALAIPLRDFFPGPTDAMLMYILMTVAAFVLVIACANIANLLLARAEARQREVAVRTAMGAGRGRILRQLLTESVLLSLLGGALGTALSIWGIRGVSGSMPAELPQSFMPVLDGTVLLYTLGISILAGLLFGVAPALHAFGDNLGESLGEGTRGGTSSRRRNRLRNSFVIAELAAALALLVGAGLLMTTFDELVTRDPGFRVDGLITTELTLSDDRYPEDGDVARFHREALRRLAEIPGVEGVAAMIDLPRGRMAAQTSYTIDGQAAPRNNEEPTTIWQAVNTDYFETLGVPMVSGRSITETDRQDSASVVVVNERFVEDHFPTESPIGRRLTLLGESREIVGVSGNVFQTRMPSPGGRIGPIVYLPMDQHPVRSMSLALRMPGEPDAVAPAIRAAIWEVDPAQPVSTVQTLEQHIETSLSGPKIISLVLAIFGAVALALSAIGIYGVMAHSVGQRKREIGIRMALGAGRREVIGMVTRQGAKLAAIGLLVGTPLAVAMTQAIRATLVSINVLDPPLMLSVVAVSLKVTLLASYLPAWKASRIEPVRALTSD